MCNLYSSARSQDEIRRTFAVDRDEAGNLPPLPGVFPDQMAPIVHAADGERVLTMMRWGFHRRRSSARSRSPTCATSPRPTGDPG